MIKITLTELAEEYEISYLKLEKRLEELKTELNSYYEEGIFLNNKILLLRKKITTMEDMYFQTKHTYKKLKNYYETEEEL